MDGIHDLGGREGFGAIDVEAPLFAEDWERRAMALTMASFLLGHNNGGQFRHSIERMAPVHYLTTRYYEHWFTGTATRLVEAGMIDLAELEERAGGRVPLSRPVVAEADEQPPVPAEDLAVGDRVRVRHWHPRGHSRCPWYVKGKRGTVVRLDPAASLPDLEAHTHDRRNEVQACVRFAATELWGPTADAGAGVHVDLWASYLTKEDG